MAAKEIALAMERRDEAGATEFERVLEACERPVLRLCYRLLGNMADAQDAAQEVFLRAFRNLSRIEGEPMPWLRTVAVNVCRDRLRRVRAVVPLPELTAGGRNPEAAAGDEERKRILVEGLASLGERERMALVLRELEGVETAEVARILEVTEETVRSQCSVAKAKLRRFVERRTAR